MEWQYKAIKILSRLVCRLSYRQVLQIGNSLGPVYSRFAQKQKKRGMRNLRIALQIDEQRADEIMERLFCHLGCSLMEVLYMPQLSQEFIKEHISLENEHYLQEALAENKGVVLLTAHVGNWEWMGASLVGYGYPTTTIVKKQPNAQFTRILNEYREMAGMEVFARGGSEMIRAVKAMKQKKILGFLADQDGGTHGLPVEFLGQESSTVLGPATFAKKFKAPIVPVFSSRTSTGHHVCVYPPIYLDDTKDEAEELHRVTEACVAVTEQFIKEHPEQWLWFQHRWRTSPDEIVDIDKKLAVREAVHEKE